MKRFPEDRPAAARSRVLPMIAATDGSRLAPLLETLAADVVAARAAACRPPVRVTLDVASGRQSPVDVGSLRDAIRQLLDAACEAAEAAPPRLREVVVTCVDTGRGLEIEVADSGGGPVCEAVATAREAVSRLGGSLASAACPEGGVAVTLCLPHRRLRSKAA